MRSRFEPNRSPPARFISRRTRSQARWPVGTTRVLPIVLPTGNYANHRYSQLKQITADNVGKLQVAWTFSTGVLRGHEGGPLVIGGPSWKSTSATNA